MSSQRAFATQLVWFTLAGLVGLGVDAGLFTSLTTLQWSVASARATSVSCMVVTTWALNRAITFAQHRSARRGAELIRYAAVQISGLVVNLSVFALCLWAFPALRPIPLVPLLFGAAAGFLFNFSMMRALVFRGAAVR